MQTSTFFLLLTGIISELVAIVVFLVWHIAGKDDELRRKDEVIVREVKHRHRVERQAISRGISRAALL